MLHQILRRTTFLALGVLTSACVCAEGACPPTGWSPSALMELKASKWAIDSPDARDTLALALVACLADPDPDLRDGLAFEALSAWLRQKQLPEALQRRLLVLLIQQLSASKPDANGFTKPFAALTLSEIARSDRLTTFLTESERSGLVDAATQYVRGVRDYRGFVDGQGWRHGVAHGADLLMQLALNPVLGKSQLEQLVAAVQSQVNPADAHFYIYGESERLVRPIVMAARRGLIAPEWWQAWIEQLGAPKPLATWTEAFNSNKGLAQLHNTKAFLLVLYANVRESPDARLQGALLEPVRQALARLP